MRVLGGDERECIGKSFPSIYVEDAGGKKEKKIEKNKFAVSSYVFNGH